MFQSLLPIKRICSKTTTNLDVPKLHVIFKMHLILAERHQVLSDPLVGIRVPLRGNSSDCHWSAKRNLQPLIGVANRCHPSSHITAVSCEVESGEVRTVEPVFRGGSSYSSVSHCFAL